MRKGNCSKCWFKNNCPEMADLRGRQCQFFTTSKDREEEVVVCNSKFDHDEYRRKKEKFYSHKSGDRRYGRYDD